MGTIAEFGHLQPQIDYALSPVNWHLSQGTPDASPRVRTNAVHFRCP